MEDKTKFTRMFIIGIVLLITVVDVYLVLDGIDENTISAFTKHASLEYPGLHSLTLLGIGFVLGHLFWVQKR